MGSATTPFRAAGVMWNRKVWTRDVKADFDGPSLVLAARPSTRGCDPALTSSCPRSS